MRFCNGVVDQPLRCVLLAFLLGIRSSQAAGSRLENVSRVDRLAVLCASLVRHATRVGRLALRLGLLFGLGRCLLDQVPDGVVRGVIVHVHVVEVLDSALDGILLHAGLQRLLDQRAVQAVVLVGQRHGRMVMGIVGHEEAIAETLRGFAAGILGGHALAAVQAVHLGALNGVHRSHRQVGVEAPPNQGFLGVGVAQVVGVEAQAPRRQAAQLLDAANGVLDGPHGRLEILDDVECLVHQLDRGHRAAVLVLGGEVTGAGYCEVGARACCQHGIDVHAVEVTEPVAKKLGAEVVHVAHFRVVLDVEAIHLIAGFLPWSGPLAGKVEQGKHNLLAVGAAHGAVVVLRGRMLLPLGNACLGLCRRHPAVVLVVDPGLVVQAHHLALGRRLKYVGDGVAALKHAGLALVEVVNDLTQLTVIHAGLHMLRRRGVGKLHGGILLATFLTLLGHHIPARTGLALLYLVRVLQAVLRDEFLGLLLGAKVGSSALDAIQRLLALLVHAEQVFHVLLAGGNGLRHRLIGLPFGHGLEHARAPRFRQTLEHKPGFNLGDLVGVVQFVPGAEFLGRCFGLERLAVGLPYRCIGLQAPNQRLALLAGYLVVVGFGGCGCGLAAVRDILGVCLAALLQRQVAECVSRLDASGFVQRLDVARRNQVLGDFHRANGEVVGVIYACRLCIACVSACSAFGFSALLAGFALGLGRYWFGCGCRCCLRCRSHRLSCLP